MNDYQYYLLKALTNWKPVRISFPAASPPESAMLGLSALRTEISRFQIFSFDVFDTLLRRDVEPPEYPKRHVCTLLSMLLAGAGHEVPMERLMAMRNEAESLARNRFLEQGKDNECRLEEILEQMYVLIHQAYTVDLAKELSLADLVEYEFEAESRHLTAMPGAIDLLRNIKMAGAKVVLVSDMYFSAAHLQRLLARNGLWGFVDHLAVSCEYGYTKASGRLFERLIAEGVLVPGKTLHAGDNLLADVQQPKSKGLDAHHFYSPEEHNRRGLRQRELRLGDLFGEFSHAQQTLFQKQSTPLTSAREIGYYRLGPVFGLFAYELVRRALTGNYQRVVFLARDGYLFSNLYGRFMRQWNVAQCMKQPEADYAYVSRASTCFADPEIDQQALLSLAQRVNRQEGVGALLSTLGFEKNAFGDLIQNILGPQTDEDLGQSGRLMATLLAHPQFQQEVSTALTEKNKLLNAYLRQQRLVDCDEKQLWVDIGWNGSIFSYLEKLIDLERFPSVDVIYFGRMYGCRPRHFNILPGVIFDQQRRNPLEHLVNECRELFEVCASSTEGSVLGYRDVRGVVIPEMAYAAPQAENNALVVELQTGIQAWCDDFIQLLNHLSPNVESLRPAALTEIGKLLTCYHPQELDILKSLQVDLSWGTQGRVSLGEYLGVGPNTEVAAYRPPVSSEQLHLRCVDSEGGEAHPQKLMEKLHQLVEMLKSEGRIAVYGVGTVATLLLPHLLDKVDFFLDGNAGLHGKQVCGKEIRSPESLAQHAGLTVFVTAIGRKNVIGKRLSAFPNKIIYIDDILG